MDERRLVREGTAAGPVQVDLGETAHDFAVLATELAERLER